MEQVPELAVLRKNTRGFWTTMDDWKVDQSFLWKWLTNWIQK